MKPTRQRRPNWCEDVGPHRLGVVSGAAFVRACRSKYALANGGQLAAGYSLAGESAIAPWGCKSCPVGFKAAAGTLTTLPENVYLIKLPEDLAKPAVAGQVAEQLRHKATKEISMPAVEKATEPAPASFPFPAKISIPLDVAPNDLTLSALRPYWTAPLLKHKKRGTCPNCQRPGLTQAGAGLCGRCYKAAWKLKGRALLAALVEVASKPQSKFRVGRPKKAAPENAAQVSPAQPTSAITMTDAIDQVLAEVRQILVTKNSSYGNSAAEPVRIFSKADPQEQINVRIDDKLSRLIRGHSYPSDNDVDDLLADLVLRKAVPLYQAASLPPAPPAGEIRPGLNPSNSAEIRRVLPGPPECIGRGGPVCESI